MIGAGLTPQVWLAQVQRIYSPVPFGHSGRRNASNLEWTALHQAAQAAQLRDAQQLQLCI